MNSKINLRARSSIVRMITLGVIGTISSGKICYDEKVCIHTDMVPKVSEKVMYASLGPKKIKPLTSIPLKREPIREAIVRPRNVNLHPVSRMIPLPRPVSGRVLSPQGDYGKLNPLFADSSISSIECSGPGKPIVVIRAGQKQFTKITLSPEEIKSFLEHVADSAHVPLMGGVFRAVVDSFSINAVISEMIGSKFIVKKQTPYALLE